MQPPPVLKEADTNAQHHKLPDLQRQGLRDLQAKSTVEHGSMAQAFVKVVLSTHPKRYLLMNECAGLCRAAITNMRGVKRFLARGRLEGPHSPPDASTAATWLKARGNTSHGHASCRRLPFHVSSLTHLLTALLPLQSRVAVCFSVSPDITSHIWCGIRQSKERRNTPRVG